MRTKSSRATRTAQRAVRRTAKPAATQARTAQCRLLLVDSHVILRLGLRALLNHEPYLEVVAEADSTDDALKCLAAGSIDLVITDLALPGARSGLDFIRELAERYPAVRTLVLTDSHSYEHARACFAAGAAGYTLKSGSQSELLDAIRAVRGGERFVNPAVASQIIVDYLGNVSAPRNSQRLPAIITKRERDVLTRVANGQENREIAEELGLSVWTIRKHRQNVMRKFSLRNAAAITAFVISHGLAVPEIAAALPAPIPRLRGR